MRYVKNLKLLLISMVNYKLTIKVLSLIVLSKSCGEYVKKCHIEDIQKICLIFVIE